MLSYTISELRVACSFQTRNCRHNCNDSKCLKLNFFLERTEPSMNFGELFCKFQKEVRCDFCWFQLVVRIRAWGLIQCKEQVALKQAQMMFCLNELLVSSNPRSEQATAKKPVFLKRNSKGDFLSLWEDNQLQLDTSWYKLIQVDSTQLTLSCYWTVLCQRPCYNCQWQSCAY